MDLISENYRTLNQKLHSDDPAYGSGSGRWADKVAGLMEREKFETVLDYGAGKGSLAKALAERGISATQYDPAVEGMDDAAGLLPHQLVVCTDVLEHVEPERIEAVIAHIHYLTSRAFFFVIACRPSSKTLADGSNAHKLIKSPEWWIEQIERRFEIVDLDMDGGQVAGLARPMAAIGEINQVSAVDESLRTENVKSNLAFFPGRLTPKDFEAPTLEPNGRVAVLVCAGPSLEQTWPQVAIARHSPDHDIIACSVGSRFLWDRNITTYAHIDCDPRPHKVTQVLPIRDGDTERFWLASCVHPDWQKVVPREKVGLWHAYNGEESFAVQQELDPGRGMIIGGGSVGLRSMSLLYFLGYRRLIIHGLDSSFGEAGEQHVTEHHGKKKSEMVVSVNGRRYRTSPILIAYARFFGKMLELMPDAEIHLAGDGLLQAMHRSGNMPS